MPPPHPPNYAHNGNTGGRGSHPAPSGPQLCLRPEPRRRPAPAFAETYADLVHLRLPDIPCESNTVLTAPYSDLDSATNPPEFSYADPSFLDEALSRFSSALTQLDCANRPCPLEARVHWDELWNDMEDSNYLNEQWVSTAGTTLLRLVCCLVIDALEHRFGFRARKTIQQPRLSFSQQGDLLAALHHHLYSFLCGLAIEWKTTTVFDNHIQGLQGFQRLPGGRITGAKALAKKMGLQLAAVSDELGVETRYGTVFTGTKMLLTSTAEAWVQGRRIPGVRFSLPLDVFGTERSVPPFATDGSVSAIALLFGLLAPSSVVQYAHLPGAEWNGLLLKLQNLSSSANGGGMGPGWRGDSRQRGGYSGRGSSSHYSGHYSSSGGQQFSGYQGNENLQTLTMRHANRPPGLFNPTRRLTKITLAYLAAVQASRCASPVASSQDGSADSPRDHFTPPESVTTDGSVASPKSRDEPLALASTGHVDLMEGLDSGTNSTVIRAALTVNGGVPFRVILKAVDRADFRLVTNEVAAYERLARANLQIIVPHFVALMTECGDSAMMVVEDAGERIGGGSWRDVTLTEADRIAIYFALVQIHTEGVLHGDVMPRNVVRRPGGTLCIIDFGLAEVDHVCERRTCEELADLRKALRLEMCV